MNNPHYFVGIDLGTTHTVVAYAPIQAQNRDIRLFAIDQLIAPGEVAARPLLPSVRYHPAASELSAGDKSFSPSGSTAVIGEAARLLGAKSQGRLVTSAKSWLSHPGVDHTAAILPWGSDEQIHKISPLAASASYLAHIRGVWNYQFPEAPLEQQNLVITVPASFDESARSLTLEAAKIAGLKSIRLLEEPQAVCYDWLRRHQENIRQALAKVHLLLVCDIGGGTTDLTLIKVEPGQHEPHLTRIGVGDHLMLGGDNIDLTLAHRAEQRFNGTGHKLSAPAFAQLLEQCRIAKERLLAEQAPETYKVALLGSGSSVIGGTRQIEFTRDEVRQVTLDGFFPLSDFNDLPDKKRSGVVEFGLPYAAEPAISKHIAAFLHWHHQAACKAVNNDRGIPDAILLNGGVFRSAAITQRTLALLKSWGNSTPQHLENRHPELAVAYGAVSYAIARQDKKIRIGGGAARSYFLLLETQDNKVQQGVCILPRGAEEGQEITLADRQFALRLGQPVRFNIASLTGGSDYQAGEMSSMTDERFHVLPPLMVAFEQQQTHSQSEAIVRLAVTLTEVGTLKIQCVAIADARQRWDVEFQVRRSKASDPQKISLSTEIAQAINKIDLIFGHKSRQINPKAVKSLRADLEKILGPRNSWETPLLRELFSALLQTTKNRRRSQHHERTWLSLTGFCLRPGFGAALDDWRVEQLWKIYPQGIQFVHETQNWTEWWTLWRRIAGGLNTSSQEKIFADLGKFLNPASARQGSIAKQGKQRSYDEMVRLAAVLERLPIEQKVQLGEWLLKRLQKASEPAQTWWALARIGARIPFHGSQHNVIPAPTASTWLKQIMSADWKKIPQAAFAATLICRMSGDRACDIDKPLRDAVITQLTQSKTPASWIKMVAELRQLDAKEEKQFFGEALPPGLKLL